MASTVSATGRSLIPQPETPYLFWSSLSVERGLLCAVCELAGIKMKFSPHSKHVNSHAGTFLSQAIPFPILVESLSEICDEFGVDETTKDHAYAALLRISSPAEDGIPWAEKIRSIDKYLKPRSDDDQNLSSLAWWHSCCSPDPRTDADNNLSTSSMSLWELSEHVKPQKSKLQGYISRYEAQLKENFQPLLSHPSPRHVSSSTNISISQLNGQVKTNRTHYGRNTPARKGNTEIVLTLNDGVDPKSFHYLSSASTHHLHNPHAKSRLFAPIKKDLTVSIAQHPSNAHSHSLIDPGLNTAFRRPSYREEFSKLSLSSTSRENFLTKEDEDEASLLCLSLNSQSDKNYPSMRSVFVSTESPTKKNASEKIADLNNKVDPRDISDPEDMIRLLAERRKGVSSKQQPSLATQPDTKSTLSNKVSLDVQTHQLNDSNNSVTKQPVSGLRAHIASMTNRPSSSELPTKIVLSPRRAARSIDEAEAEIISHLAPLDAPNDGPSMDALLAMRLLILVQRWLVDKERIAFCDGKEVGSKSLLMMRHLSNAPALTTSYFMYESWLRRKIVDICQAQGVSDVFRAWTYIAGVNVAARKNSFKRALQRGLNSFQAYHRRKQSHRDRMAQKAISSKSLSLLLWPWKRLKYRLISLPTSNQLLCDDAVDHYHFMRKSVFLPRAFAWLSNFVAIRQRYRRYLALRAELLRKSACALRAVAIMRGARLVLVWFEALKQHYHKVGFLLSDKKKYDNVHSSYMLKIALHRWKKRKDCLKKQRTCLRDSVAGLGTLTYLRLYSLVPSNVSHRVVKSLSLFSVWRSFRKWRRRVAYTCKIISGFPDSKCVIPRRLEGYESKVFYSPVRRVDLLSRMKIITSTKPENGSHRRICLAPYRRYSDPRDVPTRSRVYMSVCGFSMIPEAYVSILMRRWTRRIPRKIPSALARKSQRGRAGCAAAVFAWRTHLRRSRSLVSRTLTRSRQLMAKYSASSKVENQLPLNLQIAVRNILQGVLSKKAIALSTNQVKAQLIDVYYEHIDGSVAQRRLFVVKVFDRKLQLKRCMDFMRKLLKVRKYNLHLKSAAHSVLILISASAFALWAKSAALNRLARRACTAKAVRAWKLSITARRRSFATMLSVMNRWKSAANNRRVLSRIFVNWYSVVKRVTGAGMLVESRSIRAFVRIIWLRWLHAWKECKYHRHRTLKQALYRLAAYSLTRKPSTYIVRSALRQPSHQLARAYRRRISLQRGILALWNFLAANRYQRAATRLSWRPVRKWGSTRAQKLFNRWKSYHLLRQRDSGLAVARAYYPAASASKAISYLAMYAAYRRQRRVLNRAELSRRNFLNLCIKLSQSRRSRSLEVEAHRSHIASLARRLINRWRKRVLSISRVVAAAVQAKAYHIARRTSLAFAKIKVTVRRMSRKSAGKTKRLTPSTPGVWTSLLSRRARSHYSRLEK